MSARLITGDCMTILPTLAEASIASIVTDPPYHLTGATRFGETRSTRGFMNKEWDGGDVAFRPETWEAAGCVIRPGGYLLAFGGTRTYHRLACAIEDGGWEIVDCLQWLYGQGFPKHRSKLKPAVELICMAKAPGPVHDLSIDECRIPVADTDYAKNASGDRGHAGTREHGEATDIRAGGGSAHAGGRWPANVCLDESAAELLDAQSGILTSGANPTRRSSDKFRDVYGDFAGQETCEPARGADAGGASRFFYCAKASRAERDAGLEGLEKQRFAMSGGAQSIGLNRQQLVLNTHPTVKPIALMRWLVRLITPPGGTVLDLFMGSGTTGAACSQEGLSFVGTDITPEYVEISRRRIIHWRTDELFTVEAL
jgi:site-specific DNA-methyltransferase (adenine-specific)